MKNIARLLFASTLLLTSVSANAMLIQEGSFGGSNYQVYADDSGISWVNAQANASLLGGYLATLTSGPEDAYVAGLVNLAGLGEVWAGGFQIASSNEPDDGWTWVNGEGTFVYTNWSPGEPNDLNTEDYLGINWGADQWNDEGNLRNITGYVVEKAIPEPSIIALFGLGLLGLGFAVRRKVQS